jgi:hypothetical protein
LIDIGNNVKFRHADIRDVSSTIFIDADLTATINGCGHVLRDTLRRQRNTFPLGTPTKGFIFTLSGRSAGGFYDMLDWISKGLVPLTGSTCVMGGKSSMTNEKETRKSSNGAPVFSQKYSCIDISHPHILHDVTIYGYNDGGGPMLTGIIIYS